MKFIIFDSNINIFVLEESVQTERKIFSSTDILSRLNIKQETTSYYNLSLNIRVKNILVY